MHFTGNINVADSRAAGDFTVRMKHIIETLSKNLWSRIVRPLLLRIRTYYVRWGNSDFVKKTYWHKRIERILKDHADAKGIVFMMPSVAWDFSMFQRPQQVSVALSRRGYLIFYLEFRGLMTQYGIYKAQDGIYRMPVLWDIYRNIERPIAIAYTYNSQYLERLNAPRVIYEYIDDLGVFPQGREAMQKAHDVLLSTADVVAATARILLEDVIKKRTDAIFCPNGVDYDHFLPAREERTLPPSDLKMFADTGAPIIGYYGALANWFDYGLLEQVARSRPDWQIVLIGADYDNSIRPSGILGIPNIHWMGPRPYPILPEYLKWFDVAIIPFKINDITNSTSPLKLFEYFAGHKPVVATALHEVQLYDEVLIANNIQEFIEKTEKALVLRNMPEFISRLDKIARENTWDARVDQLLDTLMKHG